MNADEIRKKWEAIHSPAIQAVIKKWGLTYMDPEVWPDFMADFKKLSMDEKFEVLLWWASRSKP